MKKNIEIYESKIIQNSSDQQSLEWEMKRKPLFHKYDSLYAIRRKDGFHDGKKYTSYFGMVKRNNRFYEVEMVEKWLNEFVNKKFISTFQQMVKSSKWVTFGRSMDEVDQIHNKKIRKELFKKTPIYHYVAPGNENSLAKLRYIRIICTFGKIGPDKEEICTESKFSIFCSSLDSNEFENLPYHEYESINETDLKDEIGNNTINDLKELCYQRFLQIKTPCNEVTEAFIDEKDKNKIEDTDNTYKSYFDVTDKNYVMTLNEPQVAKIMFDPHDNKFYGMSITPTARGKKQERFHLHNDWVVNQYNEDLVKHIKDFAIEEDRGRWLAVPVGDKIDPLIIQSMKYVDGAPIVMYPQGNEDRCAFCSLASSLVILGFDEAAQSLITYMDYFYKFKYIEESQRIMQHIVCELRNKPDYKKFTKMYETIKIRCDKFGKQVDIMTLEKKIGNLYWITLEQKDGSRSHTICVINDWIIDSNFAKGMELSIENLNYCCYKSEYVAISFGYIFSLRKR